MLFNSIHFIIFLPIVFFIYISIPQRFRAIFFLLASYYFYMSWEPAYIILILMSTIVDFYCGKKIGSTNLLEKKKFYLICSLLLNLGLLFTFKYYNFFSNSYHHLFGIGENKYLLNVLLPVGISFYTFQTLSYTIEIYLGNQKPENNFINFAIYVSYFPQLVAGPIERPQNLLKQIRQKFNFNFSNLQNGFRMMLWGIFKKVVIADNVASYADAVFNNTSNHTSASLLIGLYLFCIQIYCDFSGYSDIAIGVSRLFNIELTKNFKTPYFAKNVPEYWNRWHISLSTWFKDYLYIPLGGNRKGKYKMYLALFLTFFTSGLWHGANYTYVFWGSLHGVLVVLTKMLKKPLPLPNFIKIMANFNIIAFAFIYFRADSISNANKYLLRIFDGDWTSIFALDLLANYILFIIPFIIIEYFMKFDSFAEFCSKIKNNFLRKSLYILLLFYIINMGVFYGKSFIYFQF